MTNASLQDVLGTILCVGVYVAIVSYMLIWPGIQVVRKYINNDMLIDGIRSKQKIVQKNVQMYIVVITHVLNY